MEAVFVFLAVLFMISEARGGKGPPPPVFDSGEPGSSRPK